MKTYARIHDGRVVELFETGADIRQLFHPSLFWVEVVGQRAVDVGWTFDGVAFNSAVSVSRPAGVGVTLSELERQLAALRAQLAALAQH